MTTAVAVLVCLLLATAMAVGAAVRAARSVVSLSRVRELAQQGLPGSRAALRVVEDPDRSGSLLQVVVPIGAVTIGWLTVVTVRSLVTGRAVGPLAVAAVLLMGFVVTVLCDAAPRAAGLAAPEKVLLRLGWFHRIISAVLAPVAALGGWIAGAALLPVGLWLDGGRGRAHTADELAELASGLEPDGAAERGTGLFAGAIGFLDVQVGDVMAPRDQIVTVPRTSTVAEAEELVHSSGHSRVLVVGEDGEVTGFLHAKDLIGLPGSSRDGLLPAGLVRVALRVEPRDRLQEVLPRMRRARRHVAVVEEGSEVLGLVTLEDVLEAIVGEINDETDRTAGGR